MRYKHCGYCCPGAKTPSHQYLLCWLSIYCVEPVSYKNATFTAIKIRLKLLEFETKILWNLVRPSSRTLISSSWNCSDWAISYGLTRFYMICLWYVFRANIRYYNSPRHFRLHQIYFHCKSFKLGLPQKVLKVWVCFLCRSAHGYTTNSGLCNTWWRHDMKRLSALPALGDGSIRSIGTNFN